MLNLDAVLFEQALFNLLDNAAKYSPDGTTNRSWLAGPEIGMPADPGRGRGHPPAELKSIFDKFFRAQKGDHVRPGTGLGLAIARGFVESMHGTITAANRTDRSGAAMTIKSAGSSSAKSIWIRPHERHPDQGHDR